MENSNSEIHKLINDRCDRIENKVESLRPCIVTRQSCDERHRDIDRRMVDKGYFKGGVAVLLLVIAILGVILAVVRF